MYSLGIDVGYSSIKLALLDRKKNIIYTTYIVHKGKTTETLREALEEVLIAYGGETISCGAITGSGSKFLTRSGAIHTANDVASLVEGSLHLNPQAGSIIEIGGQSAKYITEFTARDKSRIKISMNSNCAAGTGSFLEEQVSRLNLKLEDYSIYANRATSIPRIAGRCSVFAKTDITHHQQEGESVENILLGLAYAMVKNYRGAVMKRLPRKMPILFVGGVAHNQGIITALTDVLNLQDGELIIPEHFHTVGAVGAALIAETERRTIDINAFLQELEHTGDIQADSAAQVELPALRSFGQNDSAGKHACPGRAPSQRAIECYLGVDVGSTSTNLVLMDATQTILDYRYVKTFGKPLQTVRAGLKDLDKTFGKSLHILGVGVTGSGRYMIGKHLGADVIKDEITSQAKAAVTLNSRVDTIFEIGGQDSKYIALHDGMVTDFQMNKVCAAGTGSFIEEQAVKFAIPLNQFGSLALQSQAPIYLGERCTVFIETSIAAHLSRGASVEDLASGLCYSIVKNYLNRVVGQKKIGDHIFFQGGLAHNQGVINAFRSLTGKEMHVPPFFSVTGAYGAAILAQEEMGTEKTQFQGFDLTSHAPSRAHHQQKDGETSNNAKFHAQLNAFIFKGYEGTREPGKQTVGIPRALFTYGMFPMFYAFLKGLGLNVILSDPTNEETIRLGQEYSLDETCYPVKLINGHIAELVRQGVDYIFFPDLYTVDHPGSASRQNYGCPYMQSAFKMVNQAMNLEQRGITLLAPTVAFHLGKEFMMQSFSHLGKQLGKTPQETMQALQKGMHAFHEFEQRLEAHRQEVLQGLNPEKKTFVLISKIYGVADPVLNMGIPGKLMDMGHQVVTFYNLPEGDLSQEHPNMYWPFGQHILEPAFLIKQHPNFYAILLTHHGCGPDTALSHYFREIMDGKPYLHIEVDEHSSGVGVITRLEAFLNSLHALETPPADRLETYADKIVHHRVNIKKTFKELEAGTSVYLPFLSPYSDIFKEQLAARGICAQVLPETTKASIDTGRHYTLANEYFSLTALLGDVFNALQVHKKADQVAVFFPQTEGAEVDGQYHRLLRTKLDETGWQRVDVLAPFIEDALSLDDETRQALYSGVLAGDLIRVAPRSHRTRYRDSISTLIQQGQLNRETLKDLAREISQEVNAIPYRKRIAAIGEPLILYNDVLNDDTFQALEEQGHRVLYSPLSEALWMLWRDYADQNGHERTAAFRHILDTFYASIREISTCLGEASPFESDLASLITLADSTIGYYAGAFGRYRFAKVLGTKLNIDGIITAASTYENTGISLNVLRKGLEDSHAKPILHLTFDGNNNENDATKIQSFLYYV